MPSTLLILNGSIIVVTIIVFIVQMRKLKRKQSGQEQAYVRKKINNRYVFYMNNVFTRKKFRRVVMRYSSMACYDVDTVKKFSVKLFEKSASFALALPFISLIMLQNIMLAVLTAFVGYIYYEMSVDRAIDKEHRDIIEECSMTIQSLHDEYQVSRNIPQAVLNCDRGQKLEQPMNLIHEILIDADGEDKLDKFKQTAPVRILGTLASICFISNEEGDGGDTKESAFLDEMTALRREADAEVDRLVMTDIAFNSLSVLSLMGLILSPIADWFLLSQIPGTALYINGMYGSIEKAILIAVTIASFYLISVLRRPTVVNHVDKVEWIDSLSKHKKMRQILKDIKPKKFKTLFQVNQRLKGAISSKTIDYIYTAKVVFAGIAGVLSFLVLVGFLLTARSNLYNNYGSLSFIKTGTEMTEREYTQLKKMDNEWMAMDKIYDERGKILPPMAENEAFNFVKAHMPSLTDYDITGQVDRLEIKYTTYHSIGFKWYYVIIIYLACVVGWFAPEMSIALRKKLVEFEASEDVMQLQTMMIAIANTQMDTHTALYWLMNESTIHKAPLQYAFIEYPSDPEFALHRLKDAVASKDLKRIVTKLEKTITELSMSDAFSDILLDKEHSLVLNKMLQEDKIKSKKEWARLLSGASISIMLLGGFVGPILILGITQLLSAFQTMM